MSLSPYQFFKIYQGTYLHFTSSYNMIKYGGKAKTITQDNFNNRKDRQKFVAWANKMETSKDTLMFCVFNFLNSNDWLYCEYESARDIALTKKLFYSTFTKNITNDFNFIKQIKDDKNISFDGLISETNSGNKPPLLQALLNNTVSIEFVCLLDYSTEFINSWQYIYKIDPFLTEKLTKMKKYQPFVKLFK